MIPWSPLARGRLARPADAPATKRSETDPFGKSMYGRTEDADRAVLDRVGEIAGARGVPRAQVALAWLLHKPAVVAPIVGASKPGQLEDAVAATSLKLSSEEIATLEAPYIPHLPAGF